MSDGCIETEHLRCVYPLAAEQVENSQMEFYDAVKETAGNWKNDARAKMADRNEKHQLINQIRRQDAVILMLEKRIVELEGRLTP